MPSYEYRCRTCGDRFEVRRPMSTPVDVETRCPAGHSDPVRVFSVMATGRAAGPAAAGGCCGGGCGCG